MSRKLTDEERLISQERHKEKKRLWNAANREKRREYGRRYRERHPEKIKAKYHRDWHQDIERSRLNRRAWRYGMTVDEVNALLARGCELCGSTDKLCIDHDHETGAARGCLCNGCNVHLGLLDQKNGRQDEEWQARARSYLERSKS